MSRLTWNLEQLKSTLSQRKEIKAWTITQEHVHRRERYFMMDGKALVVDQDRDVHAQNVQAKIFVKLQKPGRHGEITKKLFTSLPLREQIDAAVDAALQTDHQAWELPSSIPAQLPQRLTTDPRMAEDLDSVMEKMTSRIEKSVMKPRRTTFNSAELFLSIHDRELHLSNGLVHRASQSRVYTETAYSFEKIGADGKSRSDEYLNTRWAVNLDDLALDELFDETSDRAEHSLDVTKPRTGKYAVIVDAEVLAMLFNDYVIQLTAVNSYNGLPFLKPGSDFIPEAKGDLISLTLDPSLPYGGDTLSVSEQGLAQNPLKLVDKNKVIATATDKQYGDYLGVPANTIRGNVVIEPGKLSHQQLTQHAPQVIEILQFSGLFADPNSGTFSSEIRLAKLYDNVRGTVAYLKGGSLSGSISENFRDARFSDKSVKRAHFSANSSQGHGYHGPEFALLSDVSIVG